MLSFSFAGEPFCFSFYAVKFEDDRKITAAMSSCALHHSAICRLCSHGCGLKAELALTLAFAYDWTSNHLGDASRERRGCSEPADGEGEAAPADGAAPPAEGEAAAAAPALPSAALRDPAPVTVSSYS